MEEIQVQTQTETEIDNLDSQSQDLSEQTEKPLQMPKAVVVDANESSIEDFKAHFKRAKEGYVVKLPHCGLNVRVKTPDMVNMVINGTFPQELMAVALQLKGLAGKTQIDKLDPEELKKLLTFLDTFFCDVVISPKFSANPPTDEEFLDVNDIDVADKFIVVELINRGVEALKMFRPE